MIAEIYHKFTTYLEDELTGDFFGTMRYLPFNRGLNQIFKNYAVSEDPQVKQILINLTDEEFDVEFWKQSENGLVEIDGYIPLASAGIGIEVKYQSGLSGENQLEKEAKIIFADNFNMETFAVHAEKAQKNSTVKVFANVNKSKKDSRYGNLFSK